MSKAGRLLVVTAGAGGFWSITAVTAAAIAAVWRWSPGQLVHLMLGGGVGGGKVGQGHVVAFTVRFARKGRESSQHPAISWRWLRGEFVKEAKV